MAGYTAHASEPQAEQIGEMVVGMLRSLGELEAAERVARQLAARGARGQVALASHLALLGKVDEAIPMIEATAKAGEKSAADAAMRLAMEPKADPRWAEIADRLFAESLKATPSDLDLLNKQAVVKHLRKKYDQEVATYREILKLSPPNQTFLNNMAWTLSEELKQPEEAIKWADEALKKLGPLPTVLDTRGVVLTRLKRYDEAVRDLESAVRDEPTGSLLFHLTTAYLKMGRAGDAKKARERVRAAGLTREQLQPSEQAEWDTVMTP